MTVILFVGWAASWMAPGLGEAATLTPTEAVKSTSEEVIRILSNEELKKPWKASERRRRLEQVIGHRLSYEEMSKRALGDYWKRLNEKERQEFVDLFKSLLAATYAGRIEGYAGEQLAYLSERQLESGYAEVRAKLVSKKGEVPIDFRLFKKDGEWRVYDIVIEGISLVHNYRGQFTKIIRTASYADLLDKLRQKTGLTDPTSAASANRP
jgi:phospholipid transport system substrate-binding protein